MVSYKFTRTRSWTTSQDYWEEFNTEDQEKWDTLLDLTSNNFGKVQEEVKAFPKKAPKEPEIWFNLYSLLHDIDLENEGGEYVADPDQIVHECALYDENGKYVCQPCFADYFA